MTQEKQMKWYNCYFAEWFPIKVTDLILIITLIIVLAFLGVRPY